MGKKSSQSSMKTSKHEKKQQLNSLIKILRPKVYITESSNFKNLVQELTGNGIYSPVESSPPPPSTSVLSDPSPPIWEIPFSEIFEENHYDHQFAYDHQENMSSLDLSFDSSCFTTPLEGSPDSSLTGSLNSEMGNSMHRQKMDFYKDLEAMLMEMETGNTICDYDDASYGMFNQDDQVCLYDYDLSAVI